MCAIIHCFANCSRLLSAQPYNHVSLLQLILSLILDLNFDRYVCLFLAHSWCPESMFLEKGRRTTTVVLLFLPSYLLINVPRLLSSSYQRGATWSAHIL